MIKSVGFIHGVSLPKLGNISEKAFVNVCAADNDTDFNSTLYSCYESEAKTSLFDQISKITCPSCFYLHQNQKKSREIKCYNCGISFYPVTRKINFDKMLLVTKSKKLRSFIEELKSYNYPKLKNKCDKLKQKLLMKKYSLIVNKKFIIPPLQFFLGNKYCTTLIKKSLLTHIAEGGDDVTIVMPKLNTKCTNKKNIKSIYTKFHHGNIDERYKHGKLNYFRQHLFSKRIGYTARCVIIPSPQIKANQVVLPKYVGKDLNWPEYVILIRYPSLDYQNVTFHKVVSYNDNSVIGIPISITKRNNADFDGDEIEIIPLYDWKVIAECSTLLDPENNLVSMQKLKISPGQDMSAGCRGKICPSIKTLEKALYEYYAVEGSKKTFDLFHRLESELCELIWERIGAGISLNFLEKLMNDYPDEYLKFEARARLDNHPLFWFTEPDSSFQIGHFYQMVKEVGKQRFAYCTSPIQTDSIRGNYLMGLSKEDFIAHSQSSRDGLIESNFSISEEGYNLFKLSFCGKDVALHYDGTVNTVGKRPKLVATKFQNILKSPNNQTRLPDSIVHLICDSILERIQKNK